jgi:hypothetical protein
MRLTAENLKPPWSSGPRHRGCAASKEDGRNAVHGGFFDDVETEARLVAASHADAERVRQQVVGVAKPAGQAVSFARRGLVTAEVKDAEFLVGLHRHPRVDAA